MDGKTQITKEFIESKISSGNQYCLRIYKAGPNWDKITEETSKLQMEHLKYLMQLKLNGMILINGPVGIAIFNTTDKEEVRRLSEEDPAVKAGRFVFEVYDWFGLPGDCLI